VAHCPSCAASPRRLRQGVEGPRAGFGSGSGATRSPGPAHHARLSQCGQPTLSTGVVQAPRHWPRQPPAPAGLWAEVRPLPAQKPNGLLRCLTLLMSWLSPASDKANAGPDPCRCDWVSVSIHEAKSQTPSRPWGHFVTGHLGSRINNQRYKSLKIPMTIRLAPNLCPIAGLWVPCSQ